MCNHKQHLIDRQQRLIREWHPTKNGNLKLHMFAKAASDQMWWLCEQGHEWQASIATRQRTGCPYCANKKVLKHFNDLETTNPKLAAQWHPTKNKTLTPQDVTAGSGKRVWWQCKQGHEWQSSVNARNHHQTGCPVCTGKKVLVGFNDFASQQSKLLSEWHPQRNSSIQPTDVTEFSNKKVWWRCEAGHEWEELISNRSLGRRCPYCSNKRLISGENDFKTQFPELAAEWHPHKNGTLNPDQVPPFSNLKVWWIGSCGHEWKTAISNRSNGSRCPYCFGRKILSGFNDLSVTHPHLLAEWDYEKNLIAPSSVSKGSNKKVHWKCSEHHEWLATVNNRANGSGCPICYKNSLLQKKSS